jgi:hypothetical protein
MTATINASNSGSGGLISTGDASGSLALQTAGTTAVTIDTSQNVGIGTTTPNISAQTSAVRALTIQGPTTWGAVEVATSGSDGADVLSGFYGFTVPSNSTNYKLPAYIGAWTEGATANQRGANMRFFTQANATAGATERMRIDSSGNLLVGVTANPSAGGNYGVCIQRNASGASFTGRINIGHGDSTGARIMSFYYSTTPAVVGTVDCTTTSTSYNTSSDYRLKNTIAPMTGALAKVALLKPVTYKWNIDNSDGEGFIAHELAEVCPHAVTGEKDAVDADGNPEYQGIDVSFLVATLTAAIQELKAELDELKAKVA